MIEMRNVTMKYGSIKALNDLSFDVEDGEFISIVGPSGSGKTTLLNVVAGLLTPKSGEVIINGVSIYKLSQRERTAFRRREFGFVFQTFNLIPYLTAIENVEIPMYLCGTSHEEQERMAKELLEKVGLGDRLMHRPAELSTGEQQRVAIARALANNGSVMLADEPTGNIDMKTGRALMEHIRRLNREDGVTLLVVTHDTEIADFADRQMKIVDGEILKEDVL